MGPLQASDLWVLSSLEPLGGVTSPNYSLSVRCSGSMSSAPFSHMDSMMISLSSLSSYHSNPSVHAVYCLVMSATLSKRCDIYRPKSCSLFRCAAFSTLKWVFFSVGYFQVSRAPTATLATRGRAPVLHLDSSFIFINHTKKQQIFTFKRINQQFCLLF